MPRPLEISGLPQGRPRLGASRSALPRVAIIGAGVSGLGIGWHLAAAGASVDVFDRGRAGSGASWAAAGMLATGVECEPGEERLLELNRLGQEMWPDFTRRLEAASRMGLGYRDEGTLVVALTHDDAEALRFTYEFQTGLGIELEWITGAEARRREPHLNPGTKAAVYSPHDHQVDNRRLACALKQAYLRAGGRLHEDCEVSAIDIVAGRAEALVIQDRRHKAEVIVLAAGAWSRDLKGLPEAARPPVRPVKGQMLALAMDPDAALLSHVLWAPNVYLVPRDDGRLLVGATVEEKGFDDRLTAGGVFALLEAAWRALPAIEELPIDEFWTGFRPTSRDDAPILGPSTIEGLVLATGHHRNGILLTPVTAEAISRLILTGETMAAIEPFGIERFSATRSEAVPAAAAGAGS